MIDSLCKLNAEEIAYLSHPHNILLHKKHLMVECPHTDLQGGNIS